VTEQVIADYRLAAKKPPKPKRFVAVWQVPVCKRVPRRTRVMAKLSAWMHEGYVIDTRPEPGPPTNPPRRTPGDVA